jgi:hypothetical protein
MGVEQIDMTYYHTRAFMNESGLNLINGISPEIWEITTYLKAIFGYLYN